MNLLAALTTYLASKVSLTVATSAFYNEMPDEPDKCFCVQEEPTSIGVPAQINATVHRIKVTVRAANNTEAKILADACWRWLLTSDSRYDTEPEEADVTGFIDLGSETFIYVWLYGVPTWSKADDKMRKYFSFYAQITTSKF